MFKKRFNLFIFSFLFCFNFVLAQETPVAVEEPAVAPSKGFRVGASFGMMIGSFGDANEGFTGIPMGATVEIDVQKFLPQAKNLTAIVTGGLITKGGNFTTEKVKYSYDFMEVSALIKYKLGVKMPANMNLSVVGGGFAATSSTNTYTKNGAEKTLGSSNDVTDGGILFGVFAERPINNKLSVFVNANYALGFSELALDEVVEATTSGPQILVGVLYSF